MFKKYGKILGLFHEQKSDFVEQLNLLQLKSKKINIVELKEKINLRNKARKNKDYFLSDKIRDELLNLGIEIKDNPDGSTGWSVKI